MNTPLISIIVPVYNIENYLERCVDSICRQTYTNLEIILVDDGSNDGSGKLCDQLAEKDNRIRVFHKENGGTSTARNLGIAHARGIYVGFVDGDDYISEDMYEILYQAIVDYDAEISQVGRDEIDEQGNLLPNICEPPAKTIYIEAEDFLKEMLLHKGDCSFCTKLVKKQLFQIAAFPVGELNEDFKLMVQLLRHVKGVVSLPAQTYHVFYRMGSNTRKADKEAFSRVFGDNVNNADMAEEIVAKEFPKLVPIAFRFGMFQRLDYLLHIPISKMNEDNVQYKTICRHVRKNWLRMLGSQYLSVKDKVYLLLFAVAPKGIRLAHKRLKNIQ